MKKALKFVGFSLLTAMFTIGLYVSIGLYGEYRQSQGYFTGLVKGKAKCLKTSYDATERAEDWQIEEFL